MNKFITIIRPEFMLFCKDACRAAAFNHLLFRIAGKSKDAPQEKIIAGEILWYAKNEQIVEEMSNAWGLCKIRQEVNELISMGLIGRKNNPEWGADRTKHFCFGEKECRKFLEFCEMHQLCVVHLDLPNEVKHLIYSSNANDKSIKCICLNHQMEPIDVSNANDEYIKAIPKEIPTEDRHTIDDYKEEGMIVAIANADRNATTQNVIPENRLQEKITDKHKAIVLSQPPEFYDAPTMMDIPVVNKPLTTQTPAVDLRSLAVNPPLDRQDAAASVQASLPASPRDDAQATPPIPSAGNGTVSTGAARASRRKNATQATLKTPEELEIDERCKALQARINEWRGYPLEVKGQIINERKCIRTLVERYTDQQIEDIYVYLFTRHWRHSKPDNRYHIGAYVVLSEAQSVLQELKAPAPQPAQQNGKAPTFVIDEERNRRNIEAMKARNAARRLAANG